MKVRYHQYAIDKTFRSSSAFVEYAERQAAKFEALRSTNANAFTWWGQALASHWQGAKNCVVNQPNDLGALQNHLREYPVIPFQSSLTRTLLEMSSHGRQQAAQEIIGFLKGSRDSQSAHHFSIGQISAHSEFKLALAFDKQSRAVGDGPMDRLAADLESRMESILDSDESKLRGQREQYDSFIASAESNFQTFNQEFTDFLLNAKDKWAATHASFVDQLATETAVELWSKRSVNHMGRYKSFRSWVIGFGICGLLAAITWIFGGFALARWAFEDDKTGQLASYTAGSIALFTLLVWGLRVLIRSMMSEDHLSTDASARSALAHTYLALIKEQAATDQDRAIILAALFAPVSDGLVKDDGMPAFSPASLAAQALTKP